jgi:uncharacterized protein (DUF2252 family)
MREASQRRSEGRQRRERLSRSDQGMWSPAPNRPDPVEVLQSAVAQRDPELLKWRWGRMAGSPFSFYRGNAALMALDLRPSPTAGLELQLCGDAHALNLGAYAAPDGSLVFDLNDFDEAVVGPFEWDLKRLCTSFVLAAEEAGLSKKVGRLGAQACAKAYREAMATYAEMAVVALARSVVRAEDGHPALQEVFAKASRDTPERLVAKALDGAGFAYIPPNLLPLSEQDAAPFAAAWSGYLDTLGFARRSLAERFDLRAFARRASGCGSLGVKDILLWAVGNGENDPLFLEFKEQPGSAWGQGSDAHRGREVAASQQRMQTWSDPFLGWATVADRPFLVRQWSDHKASIDVKEIGRDMDAYAPLCGHVLAKAHARTGDPAVLAGYLGRSETMDEAMATFSATYAEQVLRDWEAFKAAIQSGAVVAEAF